MAEKINVRFIIQIAGKPVENVDKALNYVLDKLKAEKENYKVLESDLTEPELDEKSTLYSGFIEVLARFSDVKSLLEFIIDYTPTSIEVEEPEKIQLNNDALTGVLNDMSNYILAAQSQIRKLNAHIHVMNKQKEESAKGKK